MKNIKETILPALLLVILFLVIIPFFKEKSLLILLITVVFTGISIGFFHSKKDLVIYFLGFFFVSAGEIWLVYNNVWFYPNSDILGVPYYTPFIWGFLFLNINRFFNSIIK